MTDKKINTKGGAYIGGNVNTGGGDFVGEIYLALLSKVGCI